jgi:hypothetical protein
VTCLTFSSTAHNAHNASPVEKAFVLGIRAIEFTLGITCDNTFSSGILTDSIALPAFRAAIPIIAKLSQKYRIGPWQNLNFDPLQESARLLVISQTGAFSIPDRHGRCLSTQ